MSSAPTFVDTADQASQIAWSKRLSVKTVDQAHLILRPGGPYAGTVAQGAPANDVVCYDEDLQKGNGYSIRHFLMMQLGHEGVAGNTELEDKEGGLEWADFNYSIHNLRFGISNNSPFNNQLVPFDIQNNSVALLATLPYRRIFIGALLHWTGYLGTKSSTYVDDANLQIDRAKAVWNINNSIIAASAQSHFRPASQTTDEGVEGSGSGYPTLDGLEELMLVMKKSRHRLRPAISIGGVDLWLMIVPPDFVKKLKEDSRWQSVHDQLLASGVRDPEKSPYFTGAVGCVSQLLMFETPLCPPAFHSSTSAPLTKTWRCPVLGKESLCIAFGQGYSAASPFALVTYTKDGGFKRNWHANTMVGMKRPTFTDPQDGLVYDTGVHLSTWRCVT